VEIIAEPYRDIETINSGFTGINWQKRDKITQKINYNFFINAVKDMIVFYLNPGRTSI
jgi:hypothetical protein